MKLNFKFTLVALFTVFAISPTVHAQDLSKEILARENMVWNNLGGSDAKISAFRKLLAPDYLCISPTGVLTNEEGNVAELKGFDVSSFQIEDPHVVRISPKSAVIVARVQYKATTGGRDIAGETLTSTIWVKQGKTWLAQLHQETFKK